MPPGRGTRSPCECRRALRRIWRGLAGVALSVGLLAGLPGCSDAPQDRADLVFINGAEPETLDPALITAQRDFRIVGSLFEGLMTYDKAGRPQPGVAKASPEVSPDGLVYTFHLREDARWSNGDKVTAHDFLRSWRRTLYPGTASEYAYQLHYIKNAKAFNSKEGNVLLRGIEAFPGIAPEQAAADPRAFFAALPEVLSWCVEHREDDLGVRAPDEETLVVTLENPTRFFIDLCAFPTLLPIHLPSMREAGRDWIKPGKLVGNGPYVITHWRINDRVRIEKNPLYWNRDNLTLATIDILPISDPNTALNFFCTGAADLMMDKEMIPVSVTDQLKNKDYYHAAKFLGTYFVRMNVTRPPFDDPQVRAAFAHAVDKKRIEKINRNGEESAFSLTPPGTGENYQPPPGLEFNPEKARRLLAEAGYPGGKGFPLVYYLNGRKSDHAIAIELQNMWRKELGVEVLIKKQEYKVYLESMRKLDYDLCRSSWVGDYNDPNTFLDMFVTGGGNNRTGWSDSSYDKLIARAGRELNGEKRYGTFREAEKLLISEGIPIIPIYYYVGVQFYHPDRLGGVEANLMDDHPFKEMFWKR